MSMLNRYFARKGADLDKNEQILLSLPASYLKSKKVKIDSGLIECNKVIKDVSNKDYKTFQTLFRSSDKEESK